MGDLALTIRNQRCWREADGLEKHMMASTKPPFRGSNTSNLSGNVFRVKCPIHYFQLRYPPTPSLESLKYLDIVCPPVLLSRLNKYASISRSTASGRCLCAILGFQKSKPCWNAAKSVFYYLKYPLYLDASYSDSQ
jgi:hypothetical protein